MTHLDHLELNLSNTRTRMRQQKTAADRAAFARQVAILKKEIAGEIKFLADRGIYPDRNTETMSDDEIMQQGFLTWTESR